DAHAFAALMRTSAPAEEAILEATEAPLSIGERAAQLFADLQELAGRCTERYVSDVVTAVGLASAAKLGATSTVELNIPRIADSGTRESMARRLQAIK